jgi:hypothetical protein
MKQLIEYFDRAYIINLVDRPDGRRQGERDLGSLESTYQMKRFDLYGIPPHRPGALFGVRGCFTRHRNVLELANREGLRNVLIFEDDVSLRSLGGRLRARHHPTFSEGYPVASIGARAFGVGARVLDIMSHC